MPWTFISRIPPPPPPQYFYFCVNVRIVSENIAIVKFPYMDKSQSESRGWLGSRNHFDRCICGVRRPAYTVTLFESGLYRSRKTDKDSASFCRRMLTKVVESCTCLDALNIGSSPFYLWSWLTHEITFTPCGTPCSTHQCFKWDCSPFLTPTPLCVNDLGNWSLIMHSNYLTVSISYSISVLFHFYYISQPYEIAPSHKLSTFPYPFLLFLQEPIIFLTESIQFGANATGVSHFIHVFLLIITYVMTEMRLICFHKETYRGPKEKADFCACIFKLQVASLSHEAKCPSQKSRPSLTSRCWSWIAPFANHKSDKMITLIFKHTAVFYSEWP